MQRDTSLCPALGRVPCQEEKDAAQMMHKMSKLANQNAVFNPNRSVGVVLGVDQPTIVDSDDGEWSD